MKLILQHSAAKSSGLGIFKKKPNVPMHYLEGSAKNLLLSCKKNAR